MTESECELKSESSAASMQLCMHVHDPVIRCMCDLPSGMREPPLSILEV